MSRPYHIAGVTCARGPFALAPLRKRKKGVRSRLDRLRHGQKGVKRTPDGLCK